MKIMSQNGKFIDCISSVVIKIMAKTDYKYNYWVVSNHDMVLGCYDTYERAYEILSDIMNFNGNIYKMPIK